MTNHTSNSPAFDRGREALRTDEYYELLDAAEAAAKRARAAKSTPQTEQNQGSTRTKENCQ